MTIALGSVVLSYFAPNALLAVIMPEPAGVAELLIGLAGVGYIVWRSRRRPR